jgi:NADPH-dependent 2,4-dienoyl-CoA reductase/sulfur reductase-like enzyme
MAEPRVVVVGAGPAGVRAAETLVHAGLRPVLVDEASSGGGQIYRRQPHNFTRPADALYGTEAQKAGALHASFEALAGRVAYHPNTIAWNVGDGMLHVVAGEVASVLPYDALVIASGATDRLLPVPGWTLPGVYSLGAAQIALKAQACAIGRKVAFLGTGPLLYLVAYQYAKAGAHVAAVMDTSTAGNRIRALPRLMARPRQLRHGLQYLRHLRRCGVPLLGGVTPVSILGDSTTGVTTIVARRGTTTDEIKCDAVAMGYHLRPEAQLADLARCEFRFDPSTRQWLPTVDADGRSSVKGVYLAGDGARVTGADGAEIQGRLAAFAVLKDFGRPVPHQEVTALRRALGRMERFRRGLAEAFPWPWRQAAALPDSTIVCRCEAITAGELRAAVREKGAPEVNRAKAFSRVGMGRCQGRFCSHAAAELVAAASGSTIEAVGRLRGQAPVKPLPIATVSEAAP